MIVSARNTIEDISSWIRDEIQIANAQSAVVGLSGGADSALVALLCNYAMPGMTFAVKMPCHSSPESLARADELLRYFPQIKGLTIQLDEAHNHIRDQFVSQVADYAGAGKFDAADASLRSCLRTPVLDYVAKMVNGLIVGTGNKDEDEMTRYYNKRGDGAVDISPIAQLHKSEVYHLLEYMGCPQSIIDAVPTADLRPGQEDEKELGLTYDEIEWGIRVFELARAAAEEGRGEKVYLSLNYPDAKQMLSQIFTARQVEILMKLDKMEKASRHKIMPIPVCKIRSNETVI